MATQAEVNTLVEISQVVFNDCKGAKSLETLILNFKTLENSCKKLESILKKEGYTGVGLVVQLFK